MTIPWYYGRHVASLYNIYLKMPQCVKYIHVYIIKYDRIIKHGRRTSPTLRHSPSTPLWCGRYVATGKLFLCREWLDYLGHIVRLGGLSVASRRCVGVQRALSQSTKTKLRSFHGVWNVYRCFVTSLARISTPLLNPQKWHPEVLTTKIMNTFGHCNNWNKV